MTSEPDIGDILRAEGYRLTPPRRHVWEVLAAGHGHLTVEEIARRVATREPSINLASVYRSLALFESLDLARESVLGGSGGGRWELAHPDDQFHLVCSSCGDVQHHGGAMVDDIRRHLGDEHQFEVDAIDLRVTGRCSRCGPT